jgi:hypothetical protein
MRFIVLLLLFTPASLAAQEFDSLVDLAQRAYDRQNYSVSALYYDSAFAISAGEDFSFYNAACSHSLAGNSKRSFYFLQRAFENGYSNFDWMYYDKDLDPIRSLPEYKELEKKYKNSTTIYFFDILRELLARQVVVFSNKRVSLVESVLSRYSLEEIKARTGLPFTQQPGDTIFNFSDRDLEFRNCTFENTDNDQNDLRILSLRTLHITGSKGILRLTNLNLENLLLYIRADDDNQFRSLELRNINQNGVLNLYANGNSFEMDKCKFTIKIPAAGFIPLAGNEYADMDDKNGLTWNLNYDRINIYNSSFNKDDKDNKLAPFEMAMNSKHLKIVNTSVAHVVQVRGAASESLTIKWNKFPEFVDFFNLRFPEFDCYIPFAQFNHSRFVRIDIKDLGAYEIAGDSAIEYNEESLVDNLTSFYKRLYDNYRSRADLTSSNKIYIRLKELEITHLKMKPEKDLEDRIRLLLNQVMGFYTDHATSPGKAILISFYIVLIFGVFYFFFPSDWDKTAKSQLIEDFKIFINKNEYGYVRPFFKMMKGFLLSFLNATTLSMNAFITLGFGSIPTTGLPRYVCVFQGVLGWFLLSLFTVALLNQVLL